MDSEPGSSRSEIETIILTNMPIEEENADDPAPMEFENSDGQMKIISARKPTKIEIKGEMEDEDENEIEEPEEEQYIEEEADDPSVEDEDEDEEEEEEVEDVKPVFVEPNYCKLCQRSFKTPASLKRHVTVCHPTNDPDEQVDDPLAFELCDCCGEPSDTAHTTGDFKCETCDKLFVMKASLDRHLSIEHAPNGVYTCIECNVVCASRKELVEHLNIHPLLKPFLCLQCNKEFTRKYHLDRHIAQTGCDGQPRQVFVCQVLLV